MTKLINIMLVFGVWCLCIGCTSITKIETKPGVKITIDDHVEGVEELVYGDQDVSFSSKKVLLEKEGCKPKYFFIKKDQFNVGPFIGGLFLPPVLLWTFGYRSYYNFKYKCERD